MRRGAAIVLACVFEAILILGFVLGSLGLGHENDPGAGPYRPPRLQTPAPAPPPDPLVITP
jgi:hypothetical protein